MRLNAWLLTLVVLTISSQLFAADRPSSARSRAIEVQKTCARLLEADLSGNYILTNTSDTEFRQAGVVNLSKLGAGGLYRISMAKSDKPELGPNSLMFEPSNQGWNPGDPHQKDRRLNILSIDRDQRSVIFRFADANDQHQFTYEARPVEREGAIVGDILNPDSFLLQMESGFSAEFRFTRVRLDRASEDKIMSPTIKDLMLRRLQTSDDKVFNDYIITVEMEDPMGIDEAMHVLGTREIIPLDYRPGNQGPYQRFGVSFGIYQLLENLGYWARRWQIARVDAIPVQVVNKDIVDQIRERVRQVMAQRPPQAQAAPSGSGRDMSATMAKLEEAIGGVVPPSSSSGRANNRPAAPAPPRSAAQRPAPPPTDERDEE